MRYAMFCRMLFAQRYTRGATGVRTALALYAAICAQLRI